jgi:hypothetical protein
MRKPSRATARHCQHTTTNGSQHPRPFCLNLGGSDKLAPLARGFQFDVIRLRLGQSGALGGCAGDSGLAAAPGGQIAQVFAVAAHAVGEHKISLAKFIFSLFEFILVPALYHE